MAARRVAVIGAGINGLAVARQLMVDHPGIAVTVFEKEADVAQHQSSHNSGVVHAIAALCHGQKVYGGL